MSKQAQAMLASYGRSLLGALVASIAAVGNGASPFDFSADQWLSVSNALWAAAVPPLLRYANAKDPAFGRVAESVAKEAEKKINAEIKKKVVKKAK